ncbi:MAG TPA: pyridoxamine 5'-phosphate oxidase [Gaiellaceae bacterium]
MPLDPRAQPLLEQDADRDPLRQFEAWFEEARAAGMRVPEAVALATATPDGVPSIRMVLMKGADERGFVFHTGYESRKGRELEQNPRAALLFYWDPLGRQVRIEGEVEPLPTEESDAYFATRPRGGQLAAWASRQSGPIESRDELEDAARQAASRYEGSDVPRPPRWGGYLLRPRTYEFWQHREDRLHDRLRYEQAGDGWRIVRLSP